MTIIHFVPQLEEDLASSQEKLKDERRILLNIIKMKAVIQHILKA